MHNNVFTVHYNSMDHGAEILLFVRDILWDADLMP